MKTLLKRAGLPINGMDQLDRRMPVSETKLVEQTSRFRQFVFARCFVNASAFDSERVNNAVYSILQRSFVDLHGSLDVKLKLNRYRFNLENTDFQSSLINSPAELECHSLLIFKNNPTYRFLAFVVEDQPLSSKLHEEKPMKTVHRRLLKHAGLPINSID